MPAMMSPTNSKRSRSNTPSAMSPRPSPLSLVGRRLVAESVGTFFLVLIGPGTAMIDAYTHGRVGPVGVSLAFAFVVIAMIYALGHISGAHINPAVTIAFWSVRRFPAPEVVPYVLAQCAGAVAASYALRVILGPVGSMGATLPHIPIAGAFGVEWLLSFGLMFVIMAVATDERVADGFAPLAVGPTVGCCALMAGPLTGASMNPARSLGPAVAGEIWNHQWIYWLAPITAMIVAAKAYEHIRRARSPGSPPEANSMGVQGRISRSD